MTLVLQSQIGGAHAERTLARHGERILSEVNIPQTEVVLQLALAGYQRAGSICRRCCWPSRQCCAWH